MSLGEKSWLDRHPAVIPALAAAGALAFFEGAFLSWRYRDFGIEAAAGMAKFGLVVGLATVLVLTPVVLLLRRFHPAWRRDDRPRANRAFFLGLAAALVTWSLADQWTAGPLVPPVLGPWLEGALSLLAGVAVGSWLEPPRRALEAAAWTAPLAVVVLLLPIGAPPPQGSTGSAGATGTATPGRPDVVLVSIDTLRADRLGVYGGPPSSTPEIDRFAAEGVVFERVVAAAPWTIPSVASMLTGLPTLRHGAGRPLSSGLAFRRSPLDDAHVTVTERFAEAGYRTRAVVANGFLSAAMGFGQGFESYVNGWESATGALFMGELPLPRLIVSLIPKERLGDYRAEGVTTAALDVLAEDRDEPLFLWAHYIDPHTPYTAAPGHLDLDALMEGMDRTVPEVLDDGTIVGETFAATTDVRSGMLWLNAEDRRRMAEHYDVTVSYVDRELGRLFAALRERAAQRPTLVVLTADHGEELWDHGAFEHGHNYYRELTRVPLVVWGPGKVPAGRRVDVLAGLVDVAPTLLDLAGLETPPPAEVDEGRSLVPLLAGEAAGEAPPRFAGGNLYFLPAVLVEDGPWRCILRANGQIELYDAVGDPQERNNVAYQHPEVTERLRALLEPRLTWFLGSEVNSGEEISPEAVKALKSLGYVN